MIQKHCFECGTSLIEKELEGEGIVPYCPKCEQYRFPMYNVAVSMIVIGREIKEETGMTVSQIKFNRTSFFEPSNTLMCNFTAYVKDDSELSPNQEIDSYQWFTPDDARKNIRPNSLAERFLNAYLDE